jgi:FolB domain-containing protein
MDSITLQEFRILTRIGCSEEERSHPQEITVTAEFRHPTAHIAKTDRLENAIDYMEMVEMMQTLAAVERWTIERLAEDIATAILQRWKLDGGVRVTVTKKPRILGATVSLTIERP